MARVRGKWWVWLLVAACGALVAVLFVLFPSASHSNSTVELERARDLWLAQKLKDYRIVVQQQIGTMSCRQELAVRDEQIADVRQNDCGQPATWTASHLFAWVSQLERQGTQCYPSAQLCACRLFQSTQASYNPQLGYPQHVVYSLRMQPNLLSRDYWQYAWTINGLPNCDQGQGDVVVNVLSLERQQ